MNNNDAADVGMQMIPSIRKVEVEKLLNTELGDGTEVRNVPLEQFIRQVGKEPDQQSQPSARQLGKGKAYDEGFEQITGLVQNTPSMRRKAYHQRELNMMLNKAQQFAPVSKEDMDALLARKERNRELRRQKTDSSNEPDKENP